jgi:hypothetical protein
VAISPPPRTEGCAGATSQGLSVSLQNHHPSFTFFICMTSCLLFYTKVALYLTRVSMRRCQLCQFRYTLIIITCNNPAFRAHLILGSRVALPPWFPSTLRMLSNQHSFRTIRPGQTSDTTSNSSARKTGMASLGSLLQSLLL